MDAKDKELILLDECVRTAVELLLDFANKPILMKKSLEVSAHEMQVTLKDFLYNFIFSMALNEVDKRIENSKYENTGGGARIIQFPKNKN